MLSNYSHLSVVKKSDPIIISTMANETAENNKGMNTSISQLSDMMNESMEISKQVIEEDDLLSSYDKDKKASTLSIISSKSNAALNLPSNDNSTQTDDDLVIEGRGGGRVNILLEKGKTSVSDDGYANQLPIEVTMKPTTSLLLMFDAFAIRQSKHLGIDVDMICTSHYCFFYEGEVICLIGKTPLDLGLGRWNGNKATLTWLLSNDAIAVKACADRTAALRKERDHGIHSEIMIALAQAEMHFKICQYYLLHQIEPDAPFPVFFDDNGYRIWPSSSYFDNRL